MTLDDFKSNPRTTYIAQEYERLLLSLEEAKMLLEDNDMKDLAEGEIETLTPQVESIDGADFGSTYGEAKDGAKFPG